MLPRWRCCTPEVVLEELVQLAERNSNYMTLLSIALELYQKLSPHTTHHTHLKWQYDIRIAQLRQISSTEISVKNKNKCY
jgi:hypothetical protein